MAKLILSAEAALLRWRVGLLINEHLISVSLEVSCYAARIVQVFLAGLRFQEYRVGKVVAPNSPGLLF